MTGHVASISVVIATLGGQSLEGTIDCINSGSVVPEEILICIPKEDSHKVSGGSHRNVKIVRTDCRGQVAQRAVGFRTAACDLVMQMDDDILLEKDCMLFLLQSMEKIGENGAVAPALKWQDTGEPVYRARLNPRVLKLFYWLLNGSMGYRGGVVTRAGAEIGVDPECSQSELVEAQWLAGGCVLHRRRNLVLENYFPFGGKAYCEDLIHSYLLTSRSIKLTVNTNTVAYLSRPVREPLRDYLRTLRADLRVRRYYVKLSSRSIFRMYLYYIAIIVRQLVR